MAADGSGLRQITDGPNDDSEPRWSPDGTRLSFRSDRAAKGRHQLYVLDVDVPSEARQLATLPGAVEWHRWSADGARILAGIAGNAAEQADALGSGTLGGEQDVPAWVPDVESVDDGDAERRSLWLVDVASGEARRVSAEDRNVWEADWCGAGHAVAVTSDGAGEDAWYGAGVSLIDLASGEERPLASSDVQFGWVAGSPSGATVAVIEAVCSDRVVVCGDLRLIDVASGTMSPVDLGDVDASRAVWLDEDRLLVFGRRGLVSLALEVTAGGDRPRDLDHRRVGRRALPPQRRRVRRRDRGAHVVAPSAALDRRGRSGGRRARGRRAAPRRSRRGARRGRTARGDALDLHRRPRDRGTAYAAARRGTVPARARRARRSDRQLRRPLPRHARRAAAHARIRDPRAQPAGIDRTRPGLRRVGSSATWAVSTSTTCSPASTPWSRPASPTPIASC